MTNTDIKNNIRNALMNFASGILTEKAINLFTELGYNTERQNPFSEKTFRFFKESFLDGDPRFNEEKALASEWKYIDLLFQLSGEEITKQTTLFESKKVVTSGDSNVAMESYLFFAIGLSGPRYTRTALSLITREINKLFPMPVMVLFKYGQSLTLAVINRRLHKRDERKDVLEKVGTTGKGTYDMLTKKRLTKASNASCDFCARKALEKTPGIGSQGNGQAGKGTYMGQLGHEYFLPGKPDKKKINWT